MARLPKEPADFESGRRYYVGRMNFDEQQRLTTDKHVDNLGHIPHSETKKPYSDLDYPEMEHFRFDLGEWPTFPDPDFPIDEDLPDVPGEGKRIEYNQTTPCKFMTEFNPNTIGVEEITRSNMEISENPLVSLTVDGPAEIITDLQTLFNCTDKRLNPSTEQESTGCEVAIQAFDSVDGWEVPGSSTIPVTVTGTTKAGRTCEAVFNIQACPSEFLWHPTLNPYTINVSSQVTVFVKKGVAPFTWSVDVEEGSASMGSATTKVRYNTVTTDADVCGSLEVTVTDACGTVIIGTLRVSEGTWVDQTLPETGCPLDSYGNVMELDGGPITAYQAWSSRTVSAYTGIDRIIATLITTTTQVFSYSLDTSCEDGINQDCIDTVLEGRFLDCLDYPTVTWKRTVLDSCEADHFRYGDSDCYEGDECLDEGPPEELFLVTCLFFIDMIHQRWGCAP